MPRMPGSAALAGAVLGAFLALVGARGLARPSRRGAGGRAAVTAGGKAVAAPVG